jgi:hypothetical protein
VYNGFISSENQNLTGVAMKKMEQSYVVRKIKKRNIADVETVSDEPFEWFPV